MANQSRPPRRRKSSGSGKKRNRRRRRKKSNVPAIFTFPLVLAPVALVFVLGILFWLDVPSQIYRLGGKAFRTVTNTKSTEWPPVEGDEIFGNRDGETIVEITESNLQAPLRSRSIDPCLEITNPQVSLDISGTRKEVTYTFDIEKLEPVGDQSLSVVVTGSRGSSFGIFRALPLRSFPKSMARKETVTVNQLLTISPWVKVNQSSFDNLQFYIVVNDGRYRINRKYGDKGLYSGPMYFKVSNTATYGQIESPVNARNWHDKEKEYLLSDPTSELFLTFEGAEVVSTEPFKVRTMEDIKKEREESQAKRDEDMEKRRQARNAKDANPETYYEFGNEWKKLNAAGGQFDLLVPGNTQMSMTKDDISLGESLKGRVTKYLGTTKYVTLQVEVVKFSQPKDSEDIEIAMGLPVSSLIKGFSETDVTTDLHMTFLGYPTRELIAVDKGNVKNAIDSKFIFDKEFATSIVVKYKNGLPKNPEKFWNSVMIKGRSNI